MVNHFMNSRFSIALKCVIRGCTFTSFRVSFPSMTSGRGRPSFFFFETGGKTYSAYRFIMSRLCTIMYTIVGLTSKEHSFFSFDVINIGYGLRRINNISNMYFNLDKKSFR
ncbi:hypothetical protein CDAR_73511 [Caerostris darwini]|uniref:Uncharacterized protein n=1 Tax=Caerostris darwini TaxID=1538125 RepID=A0AAV4VLR0_9ARAC|nr:hypothetical protein CDAR_73511 [Caerostris darwini]